MTNIIIYILLIYLIDQIIDYTIFVTTHGRREENGKMTKNIRFQDPKRTKEIQEDMRDYGRALAGRGLIIGGFIIIAMFLSYFFGIK